MLAAWLLSGPLNIVVFFAVYVASTPAFDGPEDIVLAAAFTMAPCAVGMLLVIAITKPLERSFLIILGKALLVSAAMALLTTVAFVLMPVVMTTEPVQAELLAEIISYIFPMAAFGWAYLGLPSVLYGTMILRLVGYRSA